MAVGGYPSSYKCRQRDEASAPCLGECKAAWWGVVLMPCMVGRPGIVCTVSPRRHRTYQDGARGLRSRGEQGSWRREAGWRGESKIRKFGGTSQCTSTFCSHAAHVSLLDNEGRLVQAHRLGGKKDGQNREKQPVRTRAEGALRGPMGGCGEGGAQIGCYCMGGPPSPDCLPHRQL